MNDEKPFGEEEKERHYGEEDSGVSGFMKGFMNEKNENVCAECDSAVDQEEAIMKKFEGETHIFCSKSCLEDFSDNF